MKLSNSESANDDDENDGNDEEDEEDDEDDEEEKDDADCRCETAGSNDDAGRFSRAHGRFVLAPATHGKIFICKIE
jgi:hypothetical protein